MNVNLELAKKLGYPRNGYILFEDSQGNCVHAKITTKPYEHDHQILTFNVPWIPQDLLEQVKLEIINR